MNKTQFHLIDLIGAVLVCATGMMYVRFVWHASGGVFWPLITGIYYFGSYGVYSLRSTTAYAVRTLSRGLKGLMIGTFFGFCGALSEEAVAVRPDTTAQLGFIACGAIGGLLIGVTYGLWEWCASSHP